MSKTILKFKRRKINKNILENKLFVHKHWLNRLVRAEIDVDNNNIRFYQLRRKEPEKQIMLKKLKFNLKNLINLTNKKIQ